MIVRMLMVIAVLAASPAAAQDASLSSSSSSVGGDASSSLPPAETNEPSDSDLEQMVRAAYTGASAFAVAHGNYFARDGVIPPLREAVTKEMAKAFATVTVAVTAVADLDAARVCLAAQGAELRFVINTYGDGVALVAVTDKRYFAYDYDPHKSSEIKVVAASDCAKLQ